VLGSGSLDALMERGRLGVPNIDHEWIWWPDGHFMFVGGAPRRGEFVMPDYERRVEEILQADSLLSSNWKDQRNRSKDDLELRVKLQPKSN
jgi:hypothetical protein